MHFAISLIHPYESVFLLFSHYRSKTYSTLKDFANALANSFILANSLSFYHNLFFSFDSL